jgi:DnaJ-domain-containing protein 1
MPSSAGILIIYIVVFALIFYFLWIRPARRRRKSGEASRLAEEKMAAEQEAVRQAARARRERESGQDAGRKAQGQGGSAPKQGRRTYGLDGRSFPCDLYEVLECSPKARPSTIKSSWRSLLKEEHPDHGGDNERAKRINEAYEILSDPTSRIRYDSENGHRVAE